MLLNVSPEELVALKAAMDLALKAASGYSVRTCPSRDVVSEHWADFTRVNNRINALEAQREFNTMKGRPKSNKKYVHVAIDDTVHARLHDYLLKVGGGTIRLGALGELVEKALSQYLYRQSVADEIDKAA